MEQVYVVYQPPSAAGWPAGTSADGGALLGVTGSFDVAVLDRGRALDCRFGTVTTAAVRVRPDLVQCRAPPYAPGFVQVQLTVGDGSGRRAAGGDAGWGAGGGGSDSAVLFTQPAAVSAAHPVFGTSGSVVWLVGSHFLHGASCRFGDALPTPAAVISSSLARCPAPEGLQAGATLTLVLDNAGYRGSSGVEWTVAGAPSVSSLSPGVGSPAGGARVRAAGAFSALAAQQCSFGSVSVAAAVADDGGSVDCVAPALSAPVEFSVRLSSLGAPGSASRAFMPVPLSAFAVLPAVITSAYGSAVKVFLEQAQGMPIDCRTGEGATARALVLSDALLSCPIVNARGPIGFVTLQLSYSGSGGDTMSAMQLQLARMPSSTFARPALGYSGGGALVHLHGASFRFDLVCHFGSAPAVLAHFVSSALLLCEQPALPAGQAVLAVTRSVETASSGSAGLDFVSVDVPVARLLLWPAQGSVDGGSQVTFEADLGAAVRDAAACFFGSVGPVAAAAGLSDGLLTCISPAHAPGSVPVLLEAASTAAAATSLFSYVSNPVLFQIRPRIAADGATMEAYELTGTSLPIDAPVTCRLSGGALMHGSLLSPRSALCYALPWSLRVGGAPSWVELVLAASASTRIAASDAGLYAGDVAAMQPTLVAVRPSHAPIGGGALLTVSGAHLGLGLVTVCALESHSAQQQQQWQFQPARAYRVSTAVLLCEAPRALAGSSLFTVQSLSSTSADWLPFSYQLPLAVVFRSPLSLVGLTSGGGAYLFSAEQFGMGSLQCNFGSVSVHAVMGGAAGAQACISPAHAPAVVRLSVSVAGQEGVATADSSTPLSYVDFPVLASVLPTEVLVGDTSLHDVAVAVDPFLALPSFPSGSLACVLRPSPTLPPSVATISRSGAIFCGALRVGSVGFQTLTLGLVGSTPALQSGATFQISSLTRWRMSVLQPALGLAVGSTLVLAVGMNFPAQAACVQGGHTGHAARVVSTSIVVCESAPFAGDDEGISSLGLQLGAGPIKTDALAFRRTTAFPLSLPTRAAASLEGGTAISLAAPAHAFDNAACRFGSFFPVYASAGSGGLQCVAPAHSAGTVPVGMSLNGRDLEQSPAGASLPLQVSYLAMPALLGVIPSSGSSEGGMACMLVAEQTAGDWSHADCLFDGSFSARVEFHASVPSCLAPAHGGGFTALQLDFPWSARSSASLEFEFRDPAAALAVHPGFGFEGAILRLTALDARLGTGCAFGLSSSQLSSVVSSALVRCEVPQPTSTGAAPLSLSPASGALRSGTAEPLVFVYLTSSPAPLHTVEPSSSPSIGGVPVNFVIPNAAQPLPSCWFGTTGPVSTISSGDGMYECLSPAHVPAANLLFAISLGSVRDMQPGQAAFSYFDLPSAVLSLPESGGRSGGFDVSLSAWGASVWSLSLGCAFGTLRVAGILSNSIAETRVTCRAPAFSEGLVALQLSYFSGGASWLGGNSNSFSFEAEPVINTVAPASGPFGGGTLVTLVGSNLATRTNACPVGHFAASAGVSSAVARCETLSSSALAHQASGWLSSAARAAGSAAAAEYTYDDPGFRVGSAAPAAGPAAGGTAVLLSVSPAIHALGAGAVSCRFGTIFPVAARVAAPGAVSCLSPASYTGAAVMGGTFSRPMPLFLSLNGLDVSPSAMLPAGSSSAVASGDEGGGGGFFWVQPLIVLVTISPASGLSGGQTPVFVSGAGFTSSASMLLCRFGTETAPATYLSPFNILCLAPPQPPGPVFVEVSANGGEDWAGGRSTVFYYTRCPTGSFCPPDTPSSLACPAGSFCPGGGGGDFNFTLCPPGTYQPLAGQTGCLPSPVGYFAPDFGMVAPLICPPGSVCDSTGTSGASGGTGSGSMAPCPPGHFCLSGTRTSNFSDFRIAERPLPCPSGFYCGPGALSNVSIANNFSTPQPCYSGYLCEPGSSTPQGSGPCPSGNYCPAGLLVPCPPRTYCPNVANTEPKPCLPGSYNDVFGQSTCKQCPLGTVCPGFTRLLPVLCPPGYVCNSIGLPLPITLCPAGHYCLNNTVTTDPLAALDVSLLLSNLPSGLTPNVTTFRPQPCFPGTYCLQGVGNSTTSAGVYFNPQPCASGSYCEWGTGTSSGGDTSLTVASPMLPCPAGSYCPEGTYIPVAVPRGSFASGTGNAQYALCLPGTYAPYTGFGACLACPAGYECPKDGTYTPTICPAGYFRSRRDSITCLPCPVGTWSPYRGLTDQALCMPCNPGLVCSVVGMTNNKPYGQAGALVALNDQLAACDAVPPLPSCSEIALQPLGQAQLCPEGFVCDAGTSQVTVKCPDGYVCGLGTTPDTQFANPCPAGYSCPAGSNYQSRFQYECIPCFYCPQATGVVMPRCPLGTASTSYAYKLENCSADQITFWRINPLHASLLALVVPPSSASNSTGLAPPPPAPPPVNSNSSAVPSSAFSAEAAGRALLESYARCQPVNFVAMQPTAVQQSGAAVLDDRNVPLVYFTVPRNYVVKLRFDFRNISKDLVYGAHYEVAIFLNQYAQQGTCSSANAVPRTCPAFDNVTQTLIPGGGYETKCPSNTYALELPSWFAGVDPNTGLTVSKKNILELSMAANDDITFRVEIRLLDGRNQKNHQTDFMDTMCVDMVGPTRGSSVANTSFHMIMPDPSTVGGGYTLALNTPPVLSSSAFGDGSFQRDPSNHFTDCTPYGNQVPSKYPTCRLTSPAATVSFNSSLSTEYLLAQRFWESQLETIAHLIEGGPEASSNASSDASTAGRRTLLQQQTSSSTDASAIAYAIGNASKLVGFIDIPHAAPLPAIASAVADVQPSEDDFLSALTVFSPFPDDAFVAMDSIPYFSGCRGFDGHINLYEVLQTDWTPVLGTGVSYGKGCTLVPPNETVPIFQWFPTPFSSVSDACDVTFTCILRELSFATTPSTSFWFQSSNDVLFYMTSRQRPINDLYAANPASSSTTTPPHDLSAYSSALSSGALLGVSFVSSSASGAPKSVVFTLPYYQITAQDKTLVKDAPPTVAMGGYVPTASHNGEYTLNIVLQALDWFQLVNAFAFTNPFYAVLFVLIAAIASLIMAVFWAICRAFTRLKHPPGFQLFRLMGLLAESQLPGMFLAFVPFFACEYIVRVIFTSFTWFVTFNNNIDLYMSASAPESAVSGRIAVSFMVMGAYLMWCAAVLLVPAVADDVAEGLLDADADAEEEEEAFSQPVYWRRTHFVTVCLLLIVFELVLTQYSTVTTYNTWLYESWFLMKWYHFFLEKV